MDMAKRRARNAQYATEWYKIDVASVTGLWGERIDVPDNVERRSVHEPCFMCGTAHGLCRHRRAA